MFFTRIFVGFTTVLMLTACGSGSGNSEPENRDQPLIDTTTPSISEVSITEQVWAVNEPVTIKFSEPMDVDSLSLLLGSLNLVDVTTEWNEDNTQVTITPITGWPSGDYSFSVEVSDIAGNSLAAQTFNISVALNFTNFQAAKVLIGSSEVTGELTSFLRYPYANQLVDAGALWIADYDQSALFKFETIPTESHVSYDQVIDSIQYLDIDDNVQSQSFDGTQGPFIHDGQLIVSEYGGNRVLIFDDIPTEGTDNFGIVIGQATFGTSNSSCSASGLLSPEMAMVGGDKFLVVDNNNRVLIWNSMPTETGQLPDLVIGQNSFDTCSSNDDDQNGAEDDQPSARTLSFPSGVWSDGEKLIIVDGNNRVLIWNEFPTENFAEADLVIGQADFVSNLSNDDTGDLSENNPSARTLSAAYEGITSNGRQIFLADSNNNRVLVWNEWPTVNYQPADVVLGQSSFTHVTKNDDNQDGVEDESASARTFWNPAGVTISNNLLIVSDTDNGRVSIFESN